MADDKKGLDSALRRKLLMGLAGLPALAMMPRMA
jgi:urea transport system substrate-binding protein